MIAPAPTLLTPTARLARNLARELAAGMTARGQAAWLAPRIYSIPAWLSRIRDDYFLNSDDDRIPISAEQALLLWQSLIDVEVFVGEPEVADLALRSWRLLHEHRLQAPDRWPTLLLSEDSGRFKAWAAAYSAECARRGLVDEWAFAGEIPQLVAQGRIESPGTIELVGFDLPATPLQVDILAAFEAVGSSIVRPAPNDREPADPPVLEFERPDEELVAAARWARELVEADPDQSIAVVVADLNSRVDQVERSFRLVFDPPAFVLQAPGPEPWHISLGKPLTDWPLVTDALAVLSMANERFTQPQATRLLRSPYLAGWPEEADARNQTLARLARSAPFDLTANELQWALRKSGAESLSEQLLAWQRVRRESTGLAWPSQWTGRFQEELTSLGFGAGRTLDSREYQVLQRWHDLLEAYSSLDVVCNGAVGRRQALAMLTQRARTVVFRERNPGVPVEVLGVEEALGSRFDALWITTLDDVTWPGAPQRDPLIPAALQAGVPRATSEGNLQRVQLELEVLLASASTTRASFARGSDETALQVSALLAEPRIEPAPPPVAANPATMATPFPDARAPGLEGAQARGGTGVLRDQSGCPFRAFAGRRLNAIDLTPPRPGLDAGQRGTVIHKALDQFWSELRGSADLAAMTPQDLERRVADAVQTALDEFTDRYRLTLTGAGRGLEHQRAVRLLMRWVDVEKKRGEFSVIEHEHEIALDLGGLALTGKIDRLDRVADGSNLLIDYKTGRTTKGDWFPEPRIVDPQLPAYAVSVDPAPGAIAFARLRPDDLGFDGLAEGESGPSGVSALAEAHYKFKALNSWPDLLQDWHLHLEALARDFRDGNAAVDPRTASVCNYCHLHALCRIAERAPYNDLTEENGGE
ncbi:MAG: PD-(D/E)XK nuclease family protein [Pseudomonadales bacterium]